MAGGETPAEFGWLDGEMLGPAGSSPEDIRKSLREKPKPSMPEAYDIREARFWQHQFLPAGSVITYPDPGVVLTERPLVACQVIGTEHTTTGIWVSVKVLGSEDENSKKEAQKYFKSKKNRVHICQVTKEGECLEDPAQGLHLEAFHWYPPGDFVADWLSPQAKKSVEKGKQMALEEEAREPGRASGIQDPGPPAGAGLRRGSMVEDRLKALGRPSALRRVSFAPDTAPPVTGKGRGTPLALLGGGPGDRAAYSRSLVSNKTAPTPVKDEVIDVEEESKKKKKKKQRSVGESLADAARTHAKDEKKVKKKRKRSSSQSRGRRSRRRSRKGSSQDSSSGSSQGSSSSDDSLIPPLKKKSQRSPGAVFSMLEEHVAERMAQDTTLGDGQTDSSSSLGKGKFHAFYQLCLKPQLDPKARDSKELFLLSRSLDLLKQGNLDQLADVLSARLMAVETAAKQGWSTARYLEVLDEGDESSAPPHILLAAQKHSRMVEKAGGKGSWSRSATWYGQEWQGDQRPRGKGKDKQKGKKGKFKGKGNKGSWGYWGEEKPKGGEGATSKKDAEK